MKFKNYCIETQNRLRKVLSENGKKNGFKRGNKHPNWHGGIKKAHDGYVSVILYSDSPYYELLLKNHSKHATLHHGLRKLKLELDRLVDIVLA